jgi:hypothetical protein
MQICIVEFLYENTIWFFYIFERPGRIQIKIEIVFFKERFFFLWERTDSFNIKKATHV